MAPTPKESKNKAEVQAEEIDPEQQERVEGTFEGNVTERVANEPQSHPDPQAAQKEQEAARESEQESQGETAEKAQEEGFNQAQEVQDKMTKSGEPKFGDYDTSPTRQGNAYEASDKAKSNNLNLAINQAQEAKKDYDTKKANAERMAKDMDVQLDDDLNRPETDEQKQADEQRTKEVEEALKGTDHETANEGAA
jgi:hypothetical protein